MKLYHFIMYLFIYGVLGWCVEVAFAAVRERRFVNRGFLKGPICPVYGFGVGLVVMLLSDHSANLLVLYGTSVVLVTAIEWITGFLLEKIFHNKWWDYSDLPLNLNGYVCVLFSFIWGIACVFIVRVVHPLIEAAVDILPLWTGWLICVVFLGILLADLYVTASEILKLNKRLKYIEELTADLHQFSEQLGAGISKRVIKAAEWQEEKTEDVKERVEDVRERMDDMKEQAQDIWERMEELREKLQKASDQNSKTVKRLLKAYPKMKSRQYKEALEELKERLKGKNSDEDKTETDERG